MQNPRVYIFQALHVFAFVLFCFPPKSIQIQRCRVCPLTAEWQGMVSSSQMEPEGWGGARKKRSRDKELTGERHMEARLKDEWCLMNFEEGVLILGDAVTGS